MSGINDAYNLLCCLLVRNENFIEGIDLSDNEVNTLIQDFCNKNGINREDYE